MRLVLEARRGPAGTPLDRRDIENGSFRIGRGGESDWVLADPERVLSKCHCQLVADADGWVVIDTSSNGTMLNGSPLSPGAEAPLRHGDRLALGSYEIEVRAAPAAEHGGARGEPSIRTSTEDPFPHPAVDEFGFMLPEADPFPPVEPARLRGAGGGPSELGADRASDLNEHIRLPRPSSELLPVDWDVPERSVPETADPVAQAPAPAAPASGPVVGDSAPVRADPVAAILGIPRPPSGPGAEADGDATGFTAFAEGAGLGGARVADPQAALRSLGEAFHALVHELRRTMMARSAIKNEFRIEQTMIRPTGNNPLKFAVDDADALSALLGTGRRSGMTPRDAVAGALRDMRLHELAVMTAMQHAVRDLLEGLAPARLEEEVGSAPFDAVAGRREIRLWRAYRGRHERATRTLQDDFDSAFARSFVRAYEVVLRQAEEADAGERPGTPAGERSGAGAPR